MYARIDLEPKTTGISLAFGQEQQINAPQAFTCKGQALTYRLTAMRPQTTS